MQNLPKQLQYFFMVCAAMGIIVTIVDMLYSSQFGFTISRVTGLGLGALSIGSSCLAVLIVAFHRLGYKNFARGMGGVLAVVFVFNVVSNMGVATSNRMVDVQKSNLQKAKWTEHKSSKTEAEAKLETFTARLAQLNTDFRKMTTTTVKSCDRRGKNCQSWSATMVPPSVPDLDTLIAEKEAERVRESGRGGCQSLCEARAAEKRHLIALRGLADKMAKTEKMIMGTQRVLANARETLANADSGISATANQSTLYSRWTVGWFGDGESVGSVRNSNELMGIAMALVIALASAGLNLAGVWPLLMSLHPQMPMRLPQTPSGPSGGLLSDLSSNPVHVGPVQGNNVPLAAIPAAAIPAAASSARTLPTQPVPEPVQVAAAGLPQQVPQHSTVVGVMTDEGAKDLVRRLQGKIREAVEAPRQQAAA